MILSVQDREQYMAELTAEQKLYLSEQMIRGRRTVFANAMAREKGYHIPEHADPETIEVLLDDWLYVGYTDAGTVSPELRCECGRPLRYQHHVIHKVTGEEKKFGIEHLKEHLGIDASIVAAIKQGFDAIDYELDEILTKMMSGHGQPESDLLAVSSASVPNDVQMHLKLGLPLLERQIRRLRQVRLQAVKPKRLPPPLPSPPQAEPPTKTSASRRNAKEQVDDLFTWLEEIEEREEPEKPLEPQREQMSDAVPGSVQDLPPFLQQQAERYLRDGVRSARVICELLIREHEASDARFATGKPLIYLPVCLHIERVFPEATVERLDQEDRCYTV